MKRDHRFSPRLVHYIVEMAAYDSARSLDLLKAIEATVESNEALRATFLQITHQIPKITEIICGRECESEDNIIDADGEVRKALESSMDNLSSMSIDLKQRRAHAAADANLRNDDGVVDSFDQLIESIADAHDALNEVNWAVMEHDANASPRSGKGPFKSARDLIESLS